MAGSTFQGAAASYEVTATVPAVPPSGPATIVSPADAQHFSAAPIMVSGTCPAATYVKLYRDNTFSGVSTCTNLQFQIQTDLTAGTNVLQAKVYNVTNQEGPQSPGITVYYDVLATPPPEEPITPPTTLRIDNVERSNYKNGAIPSTSTRPTVNGVAPPYSAITVTFHSEVTICKTKADALGWWSCTLDHALPVGVHHVDITAITPAGIQLSFPTFQINVVAGLPNLFKPRSAPLLITSEYQFQTHYVGQPFRWTLGMNGGTAPYSLTIDWGDDSHSTITRTTDEPFTMTHAYPDAKTYVVFVKSTDAKGVTTILQLNAVVKGQTIGLASLTTRGPLTSIFSSVERYLWVVWPVYIAVVFMVVSYWLGEQEVYQRMKRRGLPQVKGR